MRPITQISLRAHDGLANDFDGNDDALRFRALVPSSRRREFAKNILVFAPDTTIIDSLKEIR